ncbi:outer membrane protein [Schizosaccharomyces cryophilus OY26]|uniref:Outer membrane protein n=1 Tax=Schizosaccharomyces cryophilus (strain OY26 / ATCC MYA-4695 / CBS 11777 / NBRC 106824 / NRRL Y48691) TaxID=653667 RepID=S9VVK3_SCHCR|nr:outer membrane protein [Schizosaccharomyces cryophilus OY26]EPY50140.1 outer membrane protein [Schizosaccharomyces cryophilus OY26]
MVNLKKFAPIPEFSKKEQSNYEYEKDEYPALLERLMACLDSVINDDYNAYKATLEENSVEMHALDASQYFYIALLELQPHVIHQARDTIERSEHVYEDLRGTVENSNDNIGNYPPGMELQVFSSTLSLMDTILGFLGGSLLDSMKATYRLRTTYNSFMKLLENVRKVQQEKDSGMITVNAGNAAFVDEIVESGSMAGYGILNFLVSMFPPSYSRIISFICFNPSRKEALEGLWKSSMYNNVLGAISLVTLFTFYGMIQSIASISLFNLGAELNQLENFIQRFKARYNKSVLWQAMELKISLLTGNPEKAINIGNQTITTSADQLINLKSFDMAMAYVCVRDFKNASKQFLILEEKNSWFRGMNRFFAGCCMLQHAKELEKIKNADRDEYIAFVEDGENLLVNALSCLQEKEKKSLLPMEKFSIRKVLKWKGKAKAEKKTLLQVISVPPYIQFLYSFVVCTLGFKGYAASYKQDLLESECHDEADLALRDLLLAVIDRMQNEHESSKARLTGILQLNQNVLFQEDKDFWVIPYAYYELAASNWFMYGMKAEGEVRHLVKKAESFQGYDLEERMGILAKIAYQTLDSAD